MEIVNSFWALVPALVAIILALVTREVYFSLFVGIVMGGALWAIDCQAGIDGFIAHTFKDGFVAQISNPYNVGILIFLVLLGAVVALVKRGGGSEAFGDWAKAHIKSRVGAQLAAIIMGLLLFIDDYFNCLTVGNVMKPVADRHNVSREKLAYIIDSTAAPVCIIAPISSWAAAVAGFAGDQDNGFNMFLQTIAYNFYAILTIFTLFVLVITKVDFGPMKRAEAAQGADLDVEYDETADDEDKRPAFATMTMIAQQSPDNATSTNEPTLPKGRLTNLVVPILSLTVCSVLGMLYTGGFFGGKNDGDIIQGFAQCDASMGLALGAFCALAITQIFFVLTHVMKFKECMECFVNGFKTVVPAVLILVFAWTLKGMTESLEANAYVASLIAAHAVSLKFLLPAVIFIVACGLSLATGTSWGTFGILIPICIAAFPDASDPIRIISISACMAGAVAGDHMSVISDTTIMSSTGAGCDHMRHVITQFPYAISVAAVSIVCFTIAGITASSSIPLATGALIITATLLTLKHLHHH